MRYCFLTSVFLTLFGCTENRQPVSADPSRIAIVWADSLPGDFSFKDKWDYPEGIYVNEFGQVSCDGFCPEGTDLMKDEKGKIIKDSMDAFYRFLDTAHYNYSIECDAWCYEFAGEHYFNADKSGKDTFLCNTQGNAGTHCYLDLNIYGDTCVAQVKLNSVIKGGDAVFNCNGGNISIDKKLLQQDIVKAVFDLKFKNTKDSSKPIYWKGKIYSRILPKS